MCSSHGVLRSLHPSQALPLVNRTQPSVSSRAQCSQLVLAVPLRDEPQLPRNGLERVDALVDAVRRHADDGEDEGVGFRWDVLGQPLQRGGREVGRVRRRGEGHEWARGRM